MKKPILFLISSFAFLFSLAQGSVSGTVVDAETKQPLEGASVFAQNTTRGTLTGKDGTFHLRLDKGGYEINVTFTGYASKTINLEVTGDRTFNLELQKGDNTMGEVIIKNTAEVPDGWAKYGEFFIKYFIGATPTADSCALLTELTKPSPSGETQVEAPRVETIGGRRAVVVETKNKNDVHAKARFLFAGAHLVVVRAYEVGDPPKSWQGIQDRIVASVEPR